MESSFQELKNILESQKEILMQLTDTAREHSRALRQLDGENLRSAVGREEGLLLVLRGQDKKREEVAGELAGKLGLPASATFGSFVDKAPPHLREELKSLLHDMTGLAGELAEINSVNSLLTRQAMRVNDVIMRAYSPPANRLYTPEGKTRPDEQSVSLVNKKI